MIVLVTGGASSGKSAFAESVALCFSGPHCYVATMRHGDAETEARIARHRQARAGKGFATFELEGGVDAVLASLPEKGTVLLEDLGNLVANAKVGQRNRLMEHLAVRSRGAGASLNLVVVGNEVGADGARYDGYTRDYLEELGALSCRMAAWADVVVEVVAGIPVVVKGELQ